MNRTKCYTSVTNEVINDEIKKKARELYEISGRKPGRDLENWLEAERIIRSRVCAKVR